MHTITLAADCRQNDNWWVWLREKDMYLDSGSKLMGGADFLLAAALGLLDNKLIKALALLRHVYRRRTHRRSKGPTVCSRRDEEAMRYGAWSVWRHARFDGPGWHVQLASIVAGGIHPQGGARESVVRLSYSSNCHVDLFDLSPVAGNCYCYCMTVLMLLD